MEAQESSMVCIYPKTTVASILFVPLFMISILFLLLWLFRYRNNELVEYNFECGESKLAYISIDEMNIEPKSCPDPNLHNVDV